MKFIFRLLKLKSVTRNNHKLTTYLNELHYEQTREISADYKQIR